MSFPSSSLQQSCRLGITGAGNILQEIARVFRVLPCNFNTPARRRPPPPDEVRILKFSLKHRTAAADHPPGFFLFCLLQTRILGPVHSPLSFSLSLFLSVFLSLPLASSLSVCQLVFLSVLLSLCLPPLYLPVSSSLFLSFFMSLCLSFSLSFCLFVSPSLYLPVSLSACSLSSPL